MSSNFQNGNSDSSDRSLDLVKRSVIYNGAYCIDEQGEIVSLYKRHYGQVITSRVDRAGYYTVRLSYRGLSRTFYLHRLLAETFIPNPDLKPYVNHLDGNKLDNRICNLQWVTHAENIQHAYKTGLCNISAICKEVIDFDSGRLFKSIHEAATTKGIPYSTCKNYLSGRRKNRTRLKAKN